MDFKVGDLVYLNNDHDGCAPFLNREFIVINTNCDRNIKVKLNLGETPSHLNLDMVYKPDYEYSFGRKSLKKSIYDLNYVYTGPSSSLINNIIEDLDKLCKKLG